MKFLPAALLALLATPAIAATPVTGKWMSEGKDSIIEVGQCGGTICGRVARILRTNPDNPGSLDRNNPDAALRARPIQGLMILTGFTDGGGVWNGRIYDPRSGKTYKSKLSRNTDGTLAVQGCVLFLCQTQTWTPVR